MKAGALQRRIGTRAEAAAVALFFALLFQALGVVLGQDAGWDQANYHLSSVQAWLHGRPWAPGSCTSMKVRVQLIGHHLQTVSAAVVLV